MTTLPEHCAATIFWIMFLLGWWTAAGFICRAVRTARLYYFPPKD